jgi:hypothetical protein
LSISLGMMDEDDGLKLHTYREQQQQHTVQFQQPHSKFTKTPKLIENNKTFKVNGSNINNNSSMNTTNTSVFANNLIWSNQCLTSSRSTSPSSMISPCSTSSSAITSSSSSLRTSTSNSIVNNSNRPQQTSNFNTNQANKSERYYVNTTNRNNSLTDHSQHLSNSSKRVNSKSNSITVDDDYSGCFEDDAFEDSYPDEDEDADMANNRCNLSKLKMKQEECQFINLLNECKRWIEVRFGLL